MPQVYELLELAVMGGREALHVECCHWWLDCNDCSKNQAAASSVESREPTSGLWVPVVRCPNGCEFRAEKSEKLVARDTALEFTSWVAKEVQVCRVTLQERRHSAQGGLLRNK